MTGWPRAQALEGHDGPNATAAQPLTMRRRCGAAAVRPRPRGYDEAVKSKTPVLAIVEDFVLAAMKHAKCAFEGGGVVAWRPGLGVVGVGSDVHDASIDLYTKLQGSVHLWLASGAEVPILDGIDLNVQREAGLASYAAPPPEPKGMLYEDEAALEAAFAEHDASRGARSRGRRKSRANRSVAR
jgi:hypothetical protein